MAEAYPNSIFYGIDAAPVFPDNVKPKNCHFEIANVAERLPYPDNYFDFVHQRFLIFGLSRAGWETVSATQFIMRTVHSAYILNYRLSVNLFVF